MGNSLLRGLLGLAGIGGLAFGFFLFQPWPRMTDSQIGQLDSTIQSDWVVRAVRVAEETVRVSERACTLSKFDSVGIIDPAAPHLNFKDPRIKILMKDLFKTPQI